MLSESVEEREEKLFEGAKKIESSELSNQKEADILNSTVHGWRTRGTDLVQVSCSHRDSQRSARRLTIGELSISASSRFVCIKTKPLLYWPGGLVV